MSALSELLEALGLECPTREGELISDGVLLLEVIDSDGDVVLRQCNTPGQSWIKRLGMLRAAEVSEHKGMHDSDDD